MPSAPPRHCQTCGTKFRGRGYRCPGCRKRSMDARWAKRGTTTQRGLGADHRKAASHISPDDLCALCGNPGTDSDPITRGHIVARANGGTNDSWNYQPEHLSCNSAKQAGERTRHVTLVTGPPCSGKTTYVQQRAQPGDFVLDMDVIAQQLGSTKRWHHNDSIKAQANQYMWQAMAEISEAKQGRAWIIRSVPNAMERWQLAEWLRADRVYVLQPPLEVLVVRAEQRPQRVKTIRAVHRWLALYSRAPGDQVVTQTDLISF